MVRLGFFRSATACIGFSIVALAGCLLPQSARAATGTVTGTQPGLTPFLSQLSAVYSGGTLQSVTYQIVPKPGSLTRPLSGSYSALYLTSTGALHTDSSSLTIPVFGLYPNYTNTVYVYFYFTDGTQNMQSVNISTAAYTDPCSSLNSPTLTQNRVNTSDLNFDYIVLKDSCSSNEPAILDTDGNIRWVATAHPGSLAVALYNNGLYVSDGSSGIDRIELTDGTLTKIGDYSAAPYNVTYTGHHNIDPGRNGLIVDVNTTTETEAVDLEFDPSTGAVQNFWDLGEIISYAMTAGGDNPSSFVKGASSDWFHNNSTTYNAADNTLIVSSRENFVIAVDYDTPPDGQKKIHWILGDTTKAWYQFPSLRQYALTLESGTLPPIGQHALSIDHNGLLLLFDDGQGSLDQTPAGITRSYSAVREYQINTTAMTATAGSVYYSPNPTIFNQFCGSVYDVSGTYVVDFPQAGSNLILQGLGSTENVVFNFQYPASAGCGPFWNAYPIPSNTFNFSGSGHPPPPASVVASGGTPQTAVVSTGFGVALQATVEDANSNPVSGVTVTFTAPSTGASATFGGSATATAVTDDNGVAVSPVPVANTVSGTYNVSATVPGAPAATFTLTNTLPTSAAGYSDGRTITIAHGRVPNTDQVNFPVLINGVYSFLANVSNGGHVQNVSGYDIIFTSDPAGQNSLNWELESYNPSTGAITVWVEVPTLSHTSDTSIYMFYGNPAITTFQGGATGSAWDTNYKAVYHFGNGSTVSLLDSTTNGNNGTGSGLTAAAGEIGGAMGAAGAQYASLPFTNTGFASGSIEWWEYNYGSYSDHATYYLWGHTNADNPGFYALKYADNNNWYVGWISGSGSVNDRIQLPANNTNFPSNTWTHYAYVWTASGGIFYCDGVPIGTLSGSTAVGNVNKNFYIGSIDGAGPFGANANFDEFRISSTNRSADWIQTEYYNQSSPATFYSMASEQTVANGPVLSVCTGTNSCPGSLSFTAVAGGSNPGMQSISVSNSGTGTLSWTASVSPAASSWLSVAPGNGTDAQTLSVSVSTSGLTTGTYNGSITISAPGASGSPQTVNVSLNISSTQNSTYSYWRAITVAHGRVPNTDQVNFPVLISGVYPSLANVSNGGRVQNANGYDIIFTSDAAGQNLLTWEIESYNAATGAINAWVQVPTLSHTSDTSIYMFYGNPGITTFQGGATGSAWDTNYKAVYHFGNGSTVSLLDSTANGNNGTGSGLTAAAGEIGGAMGATGAQYASMPITNTGFASGSIEWWEYNYGSYSDNVTYYLWGHTNADNPGFYALKYADNNNWYVGWISGSGSVNDRIQLPANSANFPSNTWTHYAYVWTASGGIFYCNGVPIGTLSGSTTVGNVNKNFYIGSIDGAAPLSANANFDEFRISSTNRSADWIQTEYYNQSSPATFYSVGSENSMSAP